MQRGLGLASILALLPRVENIADHCFGEKAAAGGRADMPITLTTATEGMRKAGCQNPHPTQQASSLVGVVAQTLHPPKGKTLLPF